MKFSFVKYQGTGNDFVILDNRDKDFPKDNFSLVSKICDRRFGIGADGLILIEDAEGYNFRMVYFNADGKEGSMCGNGGRCAVAFSYIHNIAPIAGVFVAVDGEHAYEVGLDTVKIRLIDVEDISCDGNTYVLNTGSPHYVYYVENTDTVDLVKDARKIRYNDTYKEKGINVNIVEDNNGQLKMRTYERGVEDETYSCGTGTVAVALSYAEKHDIPQGKIPITARGGKLNVYFEKSNGIYTQLWLEGPATKVFKGELNLDDFIYTLD